MLKYEIWRRRKFKFKHGKISRSWWRKIKTFDTEKELKKWIKINGGESKNITIQERWVDEE